MTSLASTTTAAAGPLAALFLTASVITLGYLAACMLRPFRRCRRCHGTGRLRSLVFRAGRTCRRCHGDGEHLRPGRVALNYLRELHDKGTPR